MSRGPRFSKKSSYKCWNCEFYSYKENGWPDYHCMKCGALNVNLYRLEHPDKTRASQMSDEELRDEAHILGIPLFVPPRSRRTYTKRSTSCLFPPEL